LWSYPRCKGAAQLSFGDDIGAGAETGEKA